MDANFLKLAKNLCDLIKKAPHHIDAVNALSGQLADQIRLMSQTQPPESKSPRPTAPRGAAPPPPAPCCDSCGERVAWRKTTLVCMGNHQHIQSAEKYLEALDYRRLLGGGHSAEIGAVRAALGLKEDDSLLDAIRTLKATAAAEPSPSDMDLMGAQHVLSGNQRLSRKA